MNAENVYRKCLNHFEQKKKRKAAGNLLHKKKNKPNTIEKGLFEIMSTRIEDMFSCLKFDYFFNCS